MRYIALAEATSFIALLIASVVKRTGGGELGVHVLGPIHGGLFIAYVIVALNIRSQLGWSGRTTFWVLVGAVVPFGGYVVDWWLIRESRQRAKRDVTAPERTDDRAVGVELLWWSGCPSWERAVGIVREEMAAAGLDPERLEVHELRTDEDAEREGFVGSPTVRVDGRDIQDPGGEPVGLSCRVYRLRDGRTSALPDRADVRDALRPAPPAR